MRQFCFPPSPSRRCSRCTLALTCVSHPGFLSLSRLVRVEVFLNIPDKNWTLSPSVRSAMASSRTTSSAGDLSAPARPQHHRWTTFFMGVRLSLRGHKPFARSFKHMHAEPRFPRRPCTSSSSIEANRSEATTSEDLDHVAQLKSSTIPNPQFDPVVLHGQG